MKNRWKRSPVKVEGGYRVRGVVWTREGNHWNRLLLRSFRKSGSHEWAELIHVDDDYDFCLACLSQSLVPEVQGSEWVICGGCHARYRVIEEPFRYQRRIPPPDEGAEELDDDHVG